MKIIHKYSLSLKDIQRINLPADATVLNIQMQGETPVLYALVDDDVDLCFKLTIYMIGTGGYFPADMAEVSYKGTLNLHNSKILHIFY